MNAHRKRGTRARGAGSKGICGKLWRACRMNEAGATAVEFAFVMPILLLMFSGIVQFGSVMFLENHMTDVARDATRKIAIGDLAQADAESAVQQSLVNWSVTYNVQALITDAGGGNEDITVTISLPMSEAALIDVLGVFQNGTLTAAVTMRKEG